MAMETTTTSNKLQSALSPDGQLLGQSSTDYIGFYGASPIQRLAAAGQAAITDASGGAAAATNGVLTLTGTYNSAILGNAIATLAAQGNALRNALVSLGLIKGSA